jgi:hypothetical protein
MRRAPQGDVTVHRSRGTFGPESCTHHAKKDSLPANKGKRSAERRIVLPMSAHRRQVYAVCATHPLRGLRAFLRRRARLSALTLAALATGYYPDGSAPEPGFPKSRARGCFARSHPSLRLSRLPADRSLCRSTGAPEPPECGLAIPPAGTAPRSASSACRPDRCPLSERGDAGCNYSGDGCQAGSPPKRDGRPRRH